MRDPRRTPVGDEQIDAAQLTQIDRLVQPGAGVIKFGAVVAVAKVVDGDPVAVNFSPRSLRIVRLPVAIVGRLEREPASQNNQEPNQTDHHPTKAPPGEIGQYPNGEKIDERSNK